MRWSSLVSIVLVGVGIHATALAAGPPRFSCGTQYPSGTIPAFDPGLVDVAMANGDATGDGLDDVVLFNPRALPENITVLPADGQGRLGAPIITALTEGPASGVLADFNEDGYDDVVGYLDFSGNLDTAIAIRTMVWHDGKASVQAGAGIVADSDPDDEDLECRNKARALLAAAAAATTTAT